MPMRILNPRSNRGFTLIEILLVIGIAIVLISFGAKKFARPQTNIKKVARDFAVLSRDVRTSARLKNSTYRLVFDISPTKSEYWVESAPGAVMLKSEETLKNQNLTDKDKEKSPFQPVNRPLKGKRELPNGISIKQLESITYSQPTTKGLAYVYYSPEGLVQRSALQISAGPDVIWTLLFHPITGHIVVVEKALSLKDLAQQ